MDVHDQPALLGDGDADDAEPVRAGRIRDHPDVLAVCRWLPQPFPFGAFTGRHDHVHSQDWQGYLNLWWSDKVVHPGDYVGPPRGGLAPSSEPDYDVAMPSGVFLRVRHGVLMGWRDEPSTDLVVRADGERFEPHEYGPGNPYRLRDYQQMTQEDCRNALASVRRRRLGDPSRTSRGADDTVLAEAIAEWVRLSRMPDRCPICSVSAEPFVRGSRGLNVPGVLLRHGGAVATLAGTADEETAADVIWSLSRDMVDPARAGLVRAAEAAAKRSADTLSGWPDAPLTEDAVALVAAQALRWHGERIAARLPFWTLGWIFVARPILDRLLPDASSVVRDRMRRSLLERADRIRVDRVMRAWAAANDATQALQEFSTIATSTADLTPVDAVVDLREGAAQDQPPRPAAPRDESYDRSVQSVVAELSA